MIAFDPPYKGTDKHTNFPIIVNAVNMDTGMALVIKDDGDMEVIALDRINVDWRWDPKKRGFFSIDDPAPED